MAATPGGNIMSTSPQAALPMLAALAQYHDSEELADIAIFDSSGAAHQVHRLVLSLHSATLAKMCRETSRSRSVEIHKHVKSICLPHHVDALMDFMYKFDYEVPWNSEEDEMDLDQEVIPAFHVAMASLGVELGIKALADLATTKFNNALTDTPITVAVQTCIKLAPLAFSNPIPLPDIRTSLTTYAKDHPSLGITVYPEDPRPLLSVFITNRDGVHRRFHTLVLTSNPSPEGHKDKAPYRCPECFTDQWREEIQVLDGMHACEHCGHEASGRDWGVYAAMVRARRKRLDVEEGELFTCLGCNEEQMRRDIENDIYLYECDYCGWREMGQAWKRIQEVM